MSRRHIAVAILFGLLGCAEAARAAGSPAGRIALRETVEVRSATLRLSDFLPESAPLDLRTLAAGISLGYAPLPGTHRAFAREEILSTLRDSPELLERLDLPARVSVGRSHRVLSQEEILRAIRDSLRRNHLTGDREPAVADFEMPAAVRVLQDDPGLRVTRIEYDPLLRRTKFRLWPSAEANLLPFYVLSRTDVVFRDANASDAPRPTEFAPVPLAPRAGIREIGEARRPQEAQDAGPIIVYPGKAIMLVLTGARVRIVTSAIPLQAGRLGETIRVRDVTTKNVLQAVVLGADALRADF